MTVERPRWIVAMIVLSASLFVLFAVRVLGRDAPVLATLPRVASSPAAPVTPGPAASGPDAPPRATAARFAAAIPTQTVPCIDDTTELVVDSHGLPALCWGTHCLSFSSYGSRARPVPRPATSIDPKPVVGPEEVCTGTRCDRLGPRLRAALALVPPQDRSATWDHATIAISWGSIWDRASDRLVKTLNVDRIEALGNRLMAVTEPGRSECCSSSGSLIDARGRSHGKSFHILPLDRNGISTFALRDDRFLVFGGSSEITLIDRGHVDVAGWLLTPHHETGVEVRAAVRLRRFTFGDSDTAAVLWCEGGVCHVTRVNAGHGRPVEWGVMVLHDEVVLPLCTE